MADFQTPLRLIIFLCISVRLSMSTIIYDLVEDGDLHGRGYQRYAAHVNEVGNPLTAEAWSTGILDGQDNSIEALNKVLRKCPYDAFYFEVAPVTRKGFDEIPFEFVLMEATSLSKRKPKFQAFEEPCSQHATHKTSLGCVFSNLSGDATLIVPRPQVGIADKHYTHLANFIRGAPQPQIEALWKMVSLAYRDKVTSLKQGNLWLSTAGNGVPWLHFRLDDYPKYYRYKPFRVPIETHSDGEL